MSLWPLRGGGGCGLRYLPGHSTGRRREVYAVESRHWARLQKGPDKEEEETEEYKKEEEEEEFRSGEGKEEVNKKQAEDKKHKK